MQVALKQVQAQQHQDDFAVFEDNWESLMFFLRLKTQWNQIPLPAGGLLVTGLNYQAVQSVLQIQHIPKFKWRGLFLDLQIMEKAALEVINKAKDQ